MRAHWHAFKSVVAAHIRLTTGRVLIQIALIVQPIVIATTAYFLYRDSHVPDYAAYVFLGGGMAGMWSALTFSSASDLNRERYYGTIANLVASPTPLAFTFSAKVVANALVALLAPIINLVFTSTVLSVPLYVSQPWGLGLAVIVFLFGSSTFALCISALFLYSRSTGILMNALEYALVLLGGLIFPITVLPDWLQAVSKALPLTWGMAALRYSFSQQVLDKDFYLSLIWCTTLGLFYFALSLLMFRVIERQVRREATLDLY